MSSKRFPFPIPCGWYHIDFNEKFQSESVHTLKRFARELIIRDDLYPTCDISSQVDFVEINALKNGNFLAPIFIPAWKLNIESI